MAACEDASVPWHRVVSADGSLAVGERQRALLDAEGVPFAGGRVDLRASRGSRSSVAQPSRQQAHLGAGALGADQARAPRSRVSASVAIQRSASSPGSASASRRPRSGTPAAAT